MKARITAIVAASALISSLAQAKDVCASHPNGPGCFGHTDLIDYDDRTAVTGTAAVASSDYSQWDVYAYNVKQPDVLVTLHCHGPITKDSVYATADQTTITVSCKGAAK